MVSSRASGAADTDLVAAPGSGGVQLPQGNYEIAMRFDVPRAQVIAWRVLCPGVDVGGEVGGATQAGSMLAASARVATTGDGVCMLQVTADDANVRAGFSVTRIRGIEAHLVADAEAAQRRDQAALRARTAVTAQLLAAGAKLRPPMPPPKQEQPGTPPYPDAEWISGYWSWESGDWLWHDGAWYDEEHDFDANLIGADAGAGVHNERRYEDYPSRPFVTGIRDHRKKREHDRDHRGPATASSGSFLDGVKSVSDDSSRTTRDHRNDSDSGHNARREWVPRDADDKKDDDKSERVRDHRR